jgi:predicted metalloprotease with PDZ domain
MRMIAGRMLSLGIAWIGLVAGCGVFAHAPVVANGGAWSYVVEAPLAPSHVLEIEATFGATRDLTIADEARAHVRALEQRTPSGWRKAEGTAEGWALSGCSAPCVVRYTIDLAELAAGCGQHLDCAWQKGDATLGSVSKWLVLPRIEGDAAITLRVRAREGATFALGLRRTRGEASTYAFRASELREGSYGAFGPMHVTRIARIGADVDVAQLGSMTAMSDAEVTTWMSEGTSLIEKFYGRFPVDATVFLVPLAGGTELRFGSVLALSGASVVILAGAAMPLAKTHEQWVLVHELFHLGTPTFWGEGRWLEEGLATYYEPVLRARAGWMSEAALWEHFADQMPRGVREPASAASMEERRDIDSTYWGGALFVFLADVRIRARTEGAHSFDDVLRAALARGGDVTHVWKVADLLRLGDDVTGTHVLEELYRGFVIAGEPVDLEAELAALGIVRGPSGVTLHDDRAHARWRRGITEWHK